MPVFPFSAYWWVYVSFTAAVSVLLAVDLRLHRKPEPVGFGNALAWTGVWIAIAMAFGAGLYAFASREAGPEVARQLGLEFLAAYVVEESLSVDNMFVFALVFRFFAIPGELQHRVLFYGVLGALVARGIFIAVGVAIMRFHFILVGMGIFLVYTGLRIALQRDEAVHPGDNPVVRLARRFLPVTRELHGTRFFVREHGSRSMTPLFLVLLVLETTDIVFAIDSVPAVLAISSEPLVVYTSNVLAVLGLRSLYFVLAGAMDRFYTLKYALASILVFVGLKMSWLEEAIGGRVPIGISLGFILGTLGLAIALALTFPRRKRPEPVAEVVGPEPANRPGNQPVTITGVICLVISGASVIVATGTAGGRVLETLTAAELPPLSLLTSSLAWFVIGVALVIAGRPPRRVKRLWSSSRRRLGALIANRRGT
jgi:tellurite resistance protein TerC